MSKTLGAAALAGVAAVALAVPLGGTASSAKTMQLSAAMTAKQVVTPKNKVWKAPAAVAKAKGGFSATVSADGRKLSWRISYSGLGRPSTVIADVHLGKSGQFGPVLVRLCTACKSGQKGTAKLKAGAGKQFASGKTWVTLITPQYPNGVVRGQIKAAVS